MKFRHLLVTALAAVFLTGCATHTPTPLPPVSVTTPSEQERAQIISIVLKGLNDPDSAKFGDILVIDQKGACVAVNAKNTFGGYTGYQQAMLGGVKNIGLQLLAIKDITPNQCTNVLHELFNK